MEEGMGYRCENCNQMLQTADTKYNFAAKIADTTGALFVSFLGDHGDEVMGGMSAADFRAFRRDATTE